MVIPGLFIGSTLCTKNETALNHLGITRIISIDNTEETIPDLPCKSLKIALIDNTSQNMLRHLPAAISFILEAVHDKQPVLLVDPDGQSRCASFMCAYLMYIKRMTYDNALSVIRLKHSDAKPSFTFTI